MNYDKYDYITLVELLRRCIVETSPNKVLMGDYYRVTLAFDENELAVFRSLVFYANK